MELRGEKEHYIRICPKNVFAVTKFRIYTSERIQPHFSTLTAKQISKRIYENENLHFVRDCLFIYTCETIIFLRKVIT